MCKSKASYEIIFNKCSLLIVISFLPLQIYLTAEEEFGSENSKVLLKCFPPGKNNAFDNERRILESLPEIATRHNIPSLQWCTKGENTILILLVHYAKFLRGQR